MRVQVSMHPFAGTTPAQQPSSPPAPKPSPYLVCVKGREERVLERRVLGRLLQVAVHLARRREDALNTGRGGGRSEVLLDHLREHRPLALLGLPPGEHLDVNVGLLGVGEVLLKLVELRRRLLLLLLLLLLPCVNLGTQI
mgnify:CR=1 FL=1